MSNAIKTALIVGGGFSGMSAAIQLRKIGVDVDQKLIGGERYRDNRPVAKHMWKVVMDVLREIGALPQAMEL